MIVVSDASPLHYLVFIDEVDLLPRVLGKIIIPATVFDELNRRRTPEKIKQFFSEPPEWLSVEPDTGIIDAELNGIDPGEREAILLAEMTGADRLLIDERVGRAVAASRGLQLVGTLGVLEIAAIDGIVVFRRALYDLKKAGFVIKEDLERFFLQRLGLI